MKTVEQFKNIKKNAKSVHLKGKTHYDEAWYNTVIELCDELIKQQSPLLTDKKIEREANLRYDKFTSFHRDWCYGFQEGAEWAKYQQRINLREELIKFMIWYNRHFDMQDIEKQSKGIVDEYLGSLNKKKE